MSPRPHWDDDTLTPAERLQLRLTDAVNSIRRDWHHLIADAAEPSARLGSGAASAQITADDNDPTDADLDATTRLMALIRSVQDSLIAHCTRVIEERLDINGRPSITAAAAPYRTDVPAMCTFIATHAEWLTTQDHDEITDVATELTQYARQVHNTVDPHRREHHPLGPCPFIVDDRFCRGRVQIPLATPTEAACTSCDQTADVAWWEDVLGLASTLTKPVTIPDLVPILSERLHLTITDRQLRNWVRDGKISEHVAYGPQPKHRVFLPRTILDEVARMGRECPACGTPWHGIGDVCPSCYPIVHGRTKTYATEKPAYAVGIAPPRTINQAAPRRPEERDRCTLHDLPKVWCSCR